VECGASGLEEIRGGLEEEPRKCGTVMAAAGW